MSSAWTVSSVEFLAGEPAPVTVRAPPFLDRAGEGREAPRGVVIARGEIVRDASAVVRGREPRANGIGAAIAHLIGLFLVGLLYTENLRRSHKGRLLRVQAALLGLQLWLAALAQIALLLTPIAAVGLPVAALVVCAARVVDLGAALATALVAALLLGGLSPLDPGVMAVLALQGVGAALVLGKWPAGRRMSRTRIAAAGAVGGGAASLAYLLIHYLLWGEPPPADLHTPLRSAWLAAGGAGLAGALIAIPCLPLCQRLVGDITLGALIELEDLSHPLLVQIAESSPGTWQHSLAMANMAQIAANAIGADGRLIRVGAYYHDLGKSLQPKYFIENLAGGETSPHDSLPPPVSCDAIFAHVTEGVRVARRHGLHERIIDFMHMHHGDGLLEYFWVKCQEQGNPEGLSEAAFRYPGVRPNSRETAILAVCDAVEAASRTLRNPDVEAIEGMVRRIVDGKLHLGQLDDSGLTVADLRIISSSLMETIRHAHHGRIEYPWQRAGSLRGVVTAATTMNGQVGRSARPSRAERTRSAERGSAPELASVDLREPRGQDFALARSAGPFRRGSPPTSSAPRLTTDLVGRRDTTEPSSHALATAATEPVAAPPSWSDGGTSTAILIRPPTAAEVAAATMPEAMIEAALERSLDAAGPAEPARKPGGETAGSGGAQRS